MSTAQSLKGKKRAIVIADLEGGGTQRVVVGLVGQWLGAGAEVSVITLADQSSDRYQLPPGAKRCALDCRAPSTGLLSAISSNARRIGSIRRAVIASGADEIIAFLAATNILTSIACGGLSVRLVISERNDPAVQNLGRLWEFLRRRFYKKADCVTANSKRALETLQQYVPREKLAFVPNPLPDWALEPYDPAGREKIILAVGRLHPQKAYGRILAMFAKSHARKLGWKLVILGEGAERNNIETQIRELQITEHVEMSGFAEDVRGWYERSGIFIMMSHYEGTPNAAIEAIARGLPILASQTAGDAAGLIEQLECGYAFNGDDIELGATKINELISDPELRDALGQNGYSGITRLITPEIVRNAWENALSATARK